MTQPNSNPDLTHGVARPNRRKFLQASAAVTALTTTGLSAIGNAAKFDSASGRLTQQLSPQQLLPPQTTYEFGGDDSLFHGHHWQSLNPGYWKIEAGALRRRLTNYGDRARRTGFPYHAQTHGFQFKTDYDPSLPWGILYANQWRLSGAYEVKAEFTFRGPRPDVPEGDQADWKMYQDGFGLFGIAIGAKSLFESHEQTSNAICAGWTDDNQLKLYVRPKRKRSPQSGADSELAEPTTSAAAFPLAAGDKCTIELKVLPLGTTANEKGAATGQPEPQPLDQSRLTIKLTANQQVATLEQTLPSSQLEGYVGLVARGLIDFEVNRFAVEPFENQPRSIGVADCLSCYPLGDTLTRTGDQWTVRFVGLFASDGREVEIRVADSETPDGGWASIPVAGKAAIVNNQWRRNTAVVNVTLPGNPGAQTFYYTVWKDGQDVTADGRVGTDACGPGTGLVGDVPGGGGYVGRLPRLVAPYKLCGLSCHAINSGLQQRTAGGWARKNDRGNWLIRDQPTLEAYRHLDDYDFQIMVWEDDVWYMELVLYPPSTDDAFKIVTLSICGPTSRWQMMRHWNVINPGDHDYGMDDVKGPEQIAIRERDGLGQDRSYMQRNFQIVHHLITGAEEVDPLANPKKWRAWKMPNRDFTFAVLDSRLWRGSQDVDVWSEAGWDEFKNLFDRTNPTRSLLGEEQFGWLQELLATDSSPLICLTGLNGLHTVWAGAGAASKGHPKKFSQRDRVTADYAGWVKAGADRVLELLGSRDGVTTVYGDVHNGCIMKNRDQRVIECSFGPIGRSGGRGLIPGFGRQMKDVDDRPVEVTALYHARFADVDQAAHAPGDPYYWNFLEMEFDPAAAQPKIGLRIRNLVDPPNEPPRGGGALETTTDQTGRQLTCRLPELQTLPNADVFIVSTSGKPIRGTRSSGSGQVLLDGLVEIEPGTQVVVNAFDGGQSSSQVVVTLPLG